MSNIKVGELMTTINEFEAGKKIDGFFIVKAADCKTTNSNNKKYLDFVLGDKTGEVNAKLWELSAEDEKTYAVNMLVKVKGTALLWQNSLQLKIEKIRPATEEDNLNIDEFVISAPYKADDMHETILNYVYNMKNEDIKNIVLETLQDNEDKLMHYPAAKKNHHAIRAGLLYHVTTMLKAGEKLCEIYTSLNTDLLYGGVILHDMAKIQEMDASELGIVSEYTVEGQLLGHITQGVKNVEVIGQKVRADKEVVMLLQHMILSHHYEAEYGSPVKPMIPEAEILHYLDIIDARMFDISKATADTKPGEFSDRIWSLENRKIYKPIFTENEN
jgi:3'-5' exoribonuclease